MRIIILLIALSAYLCYGFHSIIHHHRLHSSLASAGNNELWIVGAGRLGGIVAETISPDYKTIAETKTCEKHSSLSRFASPRLRSSRTASDAASASHVLISIPPSSSDDYIAEVIKSMELWSRKGTLLFVSSTAVYGNAQGEIDESTAVDTSNPRSALLVAAENVVLSGGGNVVRFPGLYDSDRGPHSYWRRLTEEGSSIDSDGDSFLNLIHYEDAAQMCCSILRSGYRSTVFLGADDHPITRSDICKYSFGDLNLTPKFVGVSTANSLRIINDGRSRSMLGWSPVHTSFKEYMMSRDGQTNVERC